MSGDQFLKKHVACINFYVNNFSFSSVNLNIPSQKENSILAFENLHSHVLKKVIAYPELYSYIISLKRLFNPDIDTNCWLNWFRNRSFCKEAKIIYTSESFKSAVKFRLLIPGKTFVHQLSCGCSSSRQSEHIPLIRDSVGVDLSLRANMFHCLSCKFFSAAGTQERHNMVKELILFFAESFLKNHPVEMNINIGMSIMANAKTLIFTLIMVEISRLILSKLLYLIKDLLLTVSNRSLVSIMNF